MRQFIDTVLAALGALLLGALVIFFVGALVAFPVKWVWNYLMPVIFDLPTISAWQAVWMWFLSGALFRGSASTTTNRYKTSG